VLSVLDDVIRDVDDDKVTCLDLIHLTAAFNTVDNDILLDVVCCRFLVEEPAIEWCHWYLIDRMQVITVDGEESAPRPVS